MKRLTITNHTIFTISSWILVTAFVLFYFSDGIGKILQRGGSSFSRYSAFLKAFFEIIILLFSFLTLRKSKANILFTLLILFIAFLIGQFFLSLTFQDINLFENFNTLFKYFFPLIFALLIFEIIKNKHYPSLILNAYKFIIGFNSLLIVIGYLLDISVFRTYVGPWRFGYDGLIIAQNEATFIFIFALTSVYYRRFYLGIKEYFFWIVVIPSLFVATKGVYFYIILLFLFHIFRKVSLKNVLTFGLLFLIFGYFLFSTVINKILLNSYNIFMYMYDKGGLYNALLSGRNQYIDDKLLPLVIDHWSLPNFFFGGQDVVAHYIEMGFIDLFLFFGIFGFILYLFVFYQIFKLLPFDRDFRIFFGITLFIIVATAGHFFESGIAGIHFIIMLIILRSYGSDDKTTSKIQLNE